MIIKPTINHSVWYTPPIEYDLRGDKDQPLAAYIVLVHHNRLVNLAGWDQNGLPFFALHVTLVQEGDRIPVEGRYASWVPFQIGQARRQESENPR